MLCVVFVLTTVSAGVFAADSVGLSGNVSYLASLTFTAYDSGSSLGAYMCQSTGGTLYKTFSNGSQSPSLSAFSVVMNMNRGAGDFSGKYFDVFVDVGIYNNNPNVVNASSSFSGTSSVSASNGGGLGSLPVSGGIVKGVNYDTSSLTTLGRDFITDKNVLMNMQNGNGVFYRLAASFSAPSLSDSLITIRFVPTSGISVMNAGIDAYMYILNASVVMYPDKDTYDLCQKIYSRLGTMDGRLVSIVNSLSTVLSDLSLLIKTTHNIDALCDDINGAINSGNGIAEQIRSMVNQRFQSVLDYMMYAFFQTNTVNHENSWLYRLVNMFYDELIYTYSFYDAETQEWKRTDDSFLTSVASNLQVLVDHSIQLDKVDTFGASAYDKADEAGVDDMYDSVIGAGTASKTDANNFVSGGLDSLGDLGSPGDLDGYTNDYYSWFSGKTADSLDSQYGKDTRGINSSLPVIVTDYYADASKRWNSND